MDPAPVESPTPNERALRAQRIVEVLKANEGKRTFVAIRGYPDPDSIASAWAHRRLAEKAGLTCDVVHFDPVSRPENRAMVNLLDLKIRKVAGPQDLAGRPTSPASRSSTTTGRPRARGPRSSTSARTWARPRRSTRSI